MLRRMDTAAVERFADKAPKTADGKKRLERREIMVDDWQALDRALDKLG